MKKLQNLFDKHLDIKNRTAQEAETIGYMSRILIQGCWPHKEQESNTYVREDGKYKITLINPEGLPYGSYPRLIMAWVVTEATLTQKKELYLGRSLREFMRKLDIDCTGGKKGTIIRLKEQVERVFNTFVSVSVIDNGKDISHKKVENFVVANQFELWWSTTQNTADSLWESSVTLSEDFFREITEHGFPFDVRVISALKKSPLGLDIYFFLTHRIYNVNKAGKAAMIPWTALQKQLGAGYPETPQGRRNFKYNAGKYITEIILLWPGLEIKNHAKGILLYPCKPAVGASTKQ